MKQKIESLYLYYFNQFLSIECFAESHGFEIEYTKRLLEIGRRLNHRRSK